MKPALRPALRIARRGVLRARGRSTLVAALIGIPVLLISMLAVLIATASTTVEEELPRSLGQASALVMPGGREPVAQVPTEKYAVPVNSGPNGETATEGSSTATRTDTDAVRPWTAAEIGTILHGTAHPVRTRPFTGRHNGKGLALIGTELPLADPMSVGMVDLVDGRLPGAADEIVVDRRLGRRIAVGDTLELGTGRQPYTVVGVVSDGRMQRYVYGLPGSLTAAANGEDDWQTDYLLTRDTPVGWDEVRAANLLGLSVLSRAVVQNPPPPSEVAPEALVQSGGSGHDEQAVLVIAIASIVVEVVLLSGPAFAVGVRRRRRELALLAATGGTARDLRRVVFAESLVLGLGAAVLGSALALPLAAGAVALANDQAWESFGPYDVPWPQLAITVALGALSAVLAAWWPARQAGRVNVVAALAGQRDAVSSRRGLPVLGGGVAAVGAGIALGFGTRRGGEFAVVGGQLLMIIGALLLIPAVVRVISRFAGSLPPALRLAARDAARNGGRSTPAVAAVMAAVAGITALAIASTSDFAQARQDYRQELTMGTAAVYPGTTMAPGVTGSGTEDAVLSAIKSAVPGHQVLSTQALEYGTPSHPKPAIAILRQGCTDSDPLRCDITGDPAGGAVSLSTRYSPALIADAVTTEVLAGKALTAAQRAVLEHGGVLVPTAKALRPDGKAEMLIYRYENDGRITVLGRRPVAAAVLDTGTTVAEGANSNTTPLAPAVFTEATASKLGLKTQLDGYVVPPGDAPLGQADEERLTEAVLAVDASAYVYVERGFQQTYTLVFVLLSVVGALLILIGTLTATGLSLVDARPDFATLAAIGATPGTRRLMAGAQALVVGLLGSVLGLLVGAVPGVAMTWPLTAGSNIGSRHSPVIAVPWTLLGLIVLVTPAIAALAAGLFTRSRLPMGRRLAQ